MTPAVGQPRVERTREGAVERDPLDQRLDTTNANPVLTPQTFPELETVLPAEVGLKRRVVLVYEVDESKGASIPYSSMTPPMRSLRSSMEGWVAFHAS